MKSIRTKLLTFFAAGLLLGQDVQHAIDLQKKGDWKGAAEAYRAFLADHPSEAAIHSNLGVVLSQLGRFEEAEHEYSEALRLSPGNPGIELNLALVYYKSGRISDAARELNLISSSGGENAQVVLLLADCYLRMGDNKKVIELLRPLREKDQGNLGIAYVYGMALIRDQRIEEGQVVLDRILKDGNSAEAHFLLGSQMFAAGDFPGAVREFQAAADRNPDLFVRNWRATPSTSIRTFGSRKS
jgi:Flp pilus assembly protein TadD